MDSFPVHPTPAELDEIQQWFSTDPAQLAQDRPERSSAAVIGYHEENVQRLHLAYLSASAAGAALELRMIRGNNHSSSEWREMNSAAVALYVKTNVTRVNYLEARREFWNELAYALHYEEVIMSCVERLAEEAEPALAALLRGLRWRDRVRIQLALGRKILATVRAGLPLAPRRLMRGLPLIHAGV